MRLYFLVLHGLLLLLVAGCRTVPRHAPVPARAMESLTRYAETREVFLRRLSGVEPQVRAALPRGPVVVPISLHANTPVIQALGPGRQPLRMMLDTGAARLVMGARSAAKARVPTVKAGEVQATMIGVVGTEPGLVGMLGSLTIGTWQVPSWPCFVRTFESHGQGASYPENILGFDLAARWCSFLTVDYRSRQSVFGFELGYRPRGPRISQSPFQIRDGVAFITLESGGVSWEAVVDTGSFNGIEIDEAIAKKLGVQDQGQVVKGLVLMAVGGAVTSDQARLRSIMLPSLKLLGARYPRARVDISPGIPRVGSGFLRDYRVTFDFQQRKLWLEW